MQGDYMMCSEHLLMDSGVLGSLATCCLSCAALLQSHTGELEFVGCIIIIVLNKILKFYLG